MLDIIKAKLSSNKRFDTEEETKNALILPLLSYLGYDVFNTDEVKPEVVADIGQKQGEKVDYVVFIDGKPCMIIECKQRDKNPSNYINQLFRYFSATPDVKVAILTNGDDYWFFTDSRVKNIMDTEPYLKLSISNSTEEELGEFSKYSKENIGSLDIKTDILDRRVADKCGELIRSVGVGEIPDYIIDALLAESLSGLSGILDDIKDKELRVGSLRERIRDTLTTALQTPQGQGQTLKGQTMKGQMGEELSIKARSRKAVIKGDKAVIKGDKAVIKGDKAVIKGDKAVIKGDKADDDKVVAFGTVTDREAGYLNRSNIKLNHWYVFDDYTDGKWAYHTISKVQWEGKEYDINGLRNTIPFVLLDLLNSHRVTIDGLIATDKFNGTYYIGYKRKNDRVEKLVWCGSIYINLSLGADSIVKFLQNILDVVNIDHKELKFMFSD